MFHHIVAQVRLRMMTIITDIVTKMDTKTDTMDDLKNLMTTIIEKVTNKVKKTIITDGEPKALRYLQNLLIIFSNFIFSNFNYKKYKKYFGINVK